MFGYFWIIGDHTKANSFTIELKTVNILLNAFSTHHKAADFHGLKTIITLSNSKWKKTMLNTKKVATAGKIFAKIFTHRGETIIQK